MSVIRKDLGMVTAYAYAVSKGFTGTEEEFAELMASYADVAEEAASSATAAAGSATAAAASASAAQGYKTDAQTAATSAGTSASTATSKASEAANSATQAAGSATAAASSASTASTKATQADTAAGNAATNAIAAAQSASLANTKATDAATSATAAANSATQAAASASSAASAVDGFDDHVQDMIDTIPEDYTELAGDVSQLKADFTQLDGKIAASLITNTASGSIASFPDGADGVPVEDLVVDIEPVQSGSGDPSPDNVRPISGWTGANVSRTGENRLDINSFVQGSINPSDGAELSSTTRIRSPYIKLDAGTYILTAESNIKLVVDIYDLNQNFILAESHTTWANSCTFTLSEERYARVLFRKSSDSTITKAAVTQGCLKSGTDSTYVPYTGNTYSITFPTEAGTVYGGTLDVTTGVLTVDRVSVDMGTLTWSYNSTYSNFGAGIDGKKDGTTNSICSMYKNSGATSISGVQDKEYYTPSGYIRVKDLDYTDVASFTSHVNGQQFVYELATPQIYQLTPQEVTTLLGLNNIWADCGDTTVDYRADTKLYIENLTAPSEDDMVANTNIPDATYFMIGNNLYLSTTTIPAGDVINPGTNCTKMDLAAALNAINS